MLDREAILHSSMNELREQRVKYLPVSFIGIHINTAEDGRAKHNILRRAHSRSGDHFVINIIKLPHDNPDDNKYAKLLDFITAIHERVHRAIAGKVAEQELIGGLVVHGDAVDIWH